MVLTPGTRLGVYEITAQIGAGGMGEVYRATDSNLKRSVAIKVLPASVAGDADRLARFQREAEVLAALNHPNIGAIYGLEKTPDFTALVMELVEGEDLSQRIARGALPIEEALPIAKQIADALEAAHDKGIIHRDLKPANVALTKDGNVKVLDFGLAKATEAVGGSSNPASSPTITSPAMMSGVGVILGTAAYMSPEQAAGNAVDRRTDLWAFGVVLLEMLTGRAVFPGDTVPHVLAAVLKTEPDWATLPQDTPLAIRRLLRRCFDKDRRHRLDSAGAARLDIEEALIARSDVAGTLTPSGASKPRIGRGAVAAAAAAALLVGIAAGAAIMLRVFSSEPVEAAKPMRFSIVPPANYPLVVNAVNRDFALSPDGSRVAYMSGAGEGGGQLMLRDLNRLDAEPLGSDTTARSPFFSPDGRWVGYFTAGALMKKISISGGEAVTLSPTSPGNVRGAAWGEDGNIVFTSGNRGEGLYAVRDSGGEPRLLVKPDRPDEFYLFPSILPGGRTVLFTLSKSLTRGQRTILALDLRTLAVTPLLDDASQGEYVDGYLMFASGNGLHAVAFDPRRVQLSGPRFDIVDGVLRKDTGTYDFTVSSRGVIAYITGRSAVGFSRQLVWVDRQGREQSIHAPARAYTVLRLSPDETRAVVDIRSAESDIFIWDFARETLTPLTFEHVDDNPIWTADGRRVVWVSRRNGSANLYWQAADGTGRAERLTTSVLGQNPKVTTPDGSGIVFTQLSSRSSALDLWLLTLSNRTIQPLLETAFSKNDPSISPDGRWMAYQSRESGESEIYVRPFPNVDAGRWQISTAGGQQAQWSHDGRELFFIDGQGVFASVRIDRQPTFVSDAPRKVVDTKFIGGNGPWTYDVSRDGQRFLMLKDVRANDPTLPPSSSIVVMLNALEQLKSRSASRRAE